MSVPQTEVLVFVDGQEIARHILGVGTHVFGSAESCAIRITAPLVSRRHAQLTVDENGALLLADLGSTNGTFLDGQRITAPARVTPNQSIQIGDATLLVQQQTLRSEADDSVPPELSASNRYEPGAEIKRGAMGAILAARQPAIRREVAMKVMLRNISERDRLRFIEEAQITGQLEHPNIVPVHDLALDEHGEPYYTMKLVKGSPLRDVLTLLAQGDAIAIAQYPLAALLTIFQKVCDAVAFAHARGVIHRDLKPDNIMVGDYGEVFVMDWGIAKIIGGPRSGRGGGGEEGGTENGRAAFPTSNSDHGRAGARPSEPIIASARDDQRDVFATDPDTVMGTPQYMSPEQARGEVETLDQRSDIFSLGVILYELVTLQRTFPGKTTREILSKIISGDFVLPNARLRASDSPRPQHLPAGVIPDSLEAVIIKALALDRADRYQRVADFQADLTAYQGGFAAAAENAGAWKQFTLLVKRHKALSIAVAASFLLIAGITAAFTTKVVAERDRAVAGEKAAQEARRSEAEQRKIADEKKTQVEVANAENLRQSHEGSMADYAVAAQQIDHDNRWGKGVAHLARALDLEPRNPLPATRLYEAIAFGTHNNTPILLRIFIHVDDVERVGFSPDGTRIVTAGGETARVWDVVTGKPFGESMRHEDSVRSASFSPDGTRIVTTSNDKTARVWDMATGKPLGEPMRHEDSVRSASFSPDGERIVTSSYDGTARVWDAATGKPLGKPMHHEGEVSSASFSPDGKRIVTSSYDGTARVWDAATSKLLGKPMRHADMVSSASFSPDGTRIVTASGDHTARVWDVATGKPRGGPMRHEDRISSANFSPDGTRIVTVSNHDAARVWQVGSIFHPASKTPEWVREWARAIAGWRFDANGVMQPMPAQERLKILYGPHDGDDPWSRLARWLATDPAKRTIDPDSPHTCREIAERERDFGSKESLESALRYDPTVPLARLLLAEALLAEDAAKKPGQRDASLPQRAAFLRDYDLKRLPDDATLWERAARWLHEQKDDARARQTLQKLEKLAPEKAAALRKELGP